MTDAAPPRPARRMLIIRPGRTAAHGGDEVVYRRSIAFLEHYGEVDQVELVAVGKLAKFVNIARGNPPELARYVSGANIARVRSALAAQDYDALFFFNEVTFPALPATRGWAGQVVLVPHNVQSVVARTDPSLTGRAFLPVALAFERRWMRDPAQAVVCISRADVDGLAASIGARPGVFLAPPGGLPATPLAADARFLREGVLTGSYGWWRKRRDLKHFAEAPPTGLPIHANDPLALAVLADAGVAPLPEPDWAAGVRIGIITDRFVGGFKLKSLEYVARNCAVFAACDIAAEFDGLPHAATFVRHVLDRAAFERALAELASTDPAVLVAAFQAFRDACLDRYRWDRCLAPLADAMAYRARR